MIKLNNSLFELAEQQLQKEKSERIIPCYTLADIIEYAVLIRRWLDDNDKTLKKSIKLTKEELKSNHRQSQKRYILSKKTKESK